MDPKKEYSTLQKIKHILINDSTVSTLYVYIKCQLRESLERHSQKLGLLKHAVIAMICDHFIKKLDREGRVKFFLERLQNEVRKHKLKRFLLILIKIYFYQQ